MDHSVFSLSQRRLASLSRQALANSQQLLSTLRLPKFQHPALAHPAEDDSINHSLDLSFQQSVAVSHLDRQIIDKLSHDRSHNLLCY